MFEYFSKRVFLLVVFLFNASFSSSILNPQGTKDIFPCYKPVDGKCVLTNYASSSTMPLDGSIAIAESQMDCLYAKGETFVMVKTNIPMQVREEVFLQDSTRCFDDFTNCGNLGPENPPPEYTKKSGIYFVSCVGVKATPKGCPVIDDGLELTFSEDMKAVPVSPKGLYYYFDAKSKKSFDDYMEWHQKAEFSGYMRIRLPWDFSDAEAIKSADRAAQSLKKMRFFDGSKQIEERGVESGKFKSFKGVMDTCKEWGRIHENP